MQPALKVENVSYYQASQCILDNVSFEVDKPQKVALVGLNGAGKSSLIQLLVNELQTQDGQIHFAGQAPTTQMVKNLLGYQAATMSAISSLTGAEYLNFCCLLKHRLHHQAQSWIEQLIEQWGLHSCLHVPTKNLSQGNLQKLNIAQAFLGNPNYIVLDEPSQNLDPVEQERFTSNLMQLPESVLCLFSSHHISEMVTIADQVLLLDKGRLIAQLQLKDLAQYWLVSEKEIVVPGEPDIQLIFSGKKSLLYRATGIENAETMAAALTEQVDILGNSQQALMPLFNLLANEAI